MLLKFRDFTIRNSTIDDAALLSAWWNDGAIMAHAGFPNGTGQTKESIAESIKNDSDKTYRRLIIEVEEKPVGEMNYRNKGEYIAEIGIKICDFEEQNKGYGKIFLSMLISALFNDMEFKKIVLDTNLNNKRAQHVYEELGFRKIKVCKDAWKNQIGELQSVVYYEMSHGEFVDFSKRDSKKDYSIRHEEEKDYFEVENVIREAFWNIYRPGCNEHLVTHNLRTDPSFIKELDYVIEKDGEIIGTIIYSYVKLKLNDGSEKDSICFGPIGIRPDYQNAGLGQKLIRHSLEEAKKMGHKAVFITGNNKYYNRLGFESASKYGIYLDNNKDGEFKFFMVKPLIEDALIDMSGILKFSECFYPSKEETEEFDKMFPRKIKEKRPGQIEG